VVYYVHWTIGAVARHGANFDLIVGDWGDKSGPDDRHLISLEFRIHQKKPGFMVIDSKGRPAADRKLAAKSLERKEVIGTPKAKEAFRMVDAIWLGDKRIKEVTDCKGGT
jgi:hypothetical protein